MPNYRNSTAGSIDANGESVELAYRHFLNGGVGVQIVGTWTGTLTFEGTINGTDYDDIAAEEVGSLAISTQTTGNGLFKFDAVGLKAVRLRATSWSSGTAEITIAALEG
jgi:hypothetical protein